MKVSGLTQGQLGTLCRAVLWHAVPTVASGILAVHLLSPHDFCQELGSGGTPFPGHAQFRVNAVYIHGSGSTDSGALRFMEQRWMSGTIKES